MSPSSLLQAAYLEIAEDTKFIRLAILTTLVHSLIFVFVLWYNISMMLDHVESSGVKISQILIYLRGIIPLDTLWWWGIGVGLILLIGNFILPPVGEGAMIHYLQSSQKWSKSLSKGLGSFFPMFEYDGLIYRFSILVFLIFVSRLWILGVLSNPFVIVVLFLWLFIVLIVGFLTPYAKFAIVIEKLWVIDGIQRSATLAIENFSITFQFYIFNHILNIRFILNIVILIGIPLVMMYVANTLWLLSNAWVTTLISGVIVALIILIAYINSIIEAFFVNYRYKVYSQITQL